jgi:hypothetical protein
VIAEWMRLNRPSLCVAERPLPKILEVLFCLLTLFSGSPGSSWGHASARSERRRDFRE